MLEPLIKLLDRPIVSESSFGHLSADNPEGRDWSNTSGGSVELEYINLLAALVTLIKPEAILESGSHHGASGIGLLYGSAPGTKLVTIDASPMPPDAFAKLKAVADSRGCTVEQIVDNTKNLMRPRDTRLADATGGKANVILLDSHLADRAGELAVWCDPRNGIVDMARSVCVAIHDFSRCRPQSADGCEWLPGAAASIESFCAAFGFQRLRFHSSRGMYLLYRHPTDPKPPLPCSAR